MPTLAPNDRHGFEIALICALPVEADYVESIFDKFWEDENKSYGKAHGDPNTYTPGVVSGHNVVLAHMPGMGKVSAASVASTLKISFPRIKLAIVVGICGGVPQDKDHEEEIVLGDVIISQALVQYDFGRQYPEAFARKNTVEESLSRPTPEIRSFLAKLQTLYSRERLRRESASHLETLRATFPKLRYPGVPLDKLYSPAYVHRHRTSPPHSHKCSMCSDDHICLEARTLSCEELGCDDTHLIPRQRLLDAIESQRDPFPCVHFGKMGSGDSVIKSGVLRDAMAKEDGIIAFEMEGAGLWEHFPSIIVKGVCDYADSHKNKRWQRYAAATAACCVKAVLTQWTAEDIDLDSEKTNQDDRLKLVWHVPFDIMPHFFGRDGEIQILQTKLFQADIGRRIAVFGLGGVGKSRIAWEMANYARSLGQYSVFWVQGNSASTIENDYLGIGHKLKIPRLTDEGSEIKALVKQRLSTESAGRWLLILDNADDESLWSPRLKYEGRNHSLADCLPRSRLGSVLVTTRSRRVAVQLASKEILELQQMDETGAIDLLKGGVIEVSDMDDRDIDAMSILVNRLAYLPLAIVQAAAYINVNNLCIHEYLDLLESSDEQDIVDLLNEEFEDETRSQQAQNCVASTWLISFRQIQSNNSRAIDFLSYISCLNEKDIPQSLLPDVTSKKEFADIVGTLTGYSFLKRQSQRHLSNPVYSTHRLVRLATRNWLRSQGTFVHWVQVALRRVTALFPSGDFESRETWKMYMSHAESLCATMESFDLEQRYELLRKMGLCLVADGAYQMSVRPFSTVLGWQLQREDEADDKVLEARLNLGSALLRAGHWTEAEPQLMSVISAQNGLSNPDHPLVTLAMKSLSQLYNKQGRLVDAEKLIKQVVERNERVLGPHSSETIMSKSVLAKVYDRQERLIEAEILESQVFEEIRKIHDLEHLDTLAVMHCLAEIKFKRDKLTEAEKLCDLVVETSKKLFGPEHPHTLDRLALRSRVYVSQGRKDEAIVILESLVEMVQKVLGPEHPDTLYYSSRLASVYFQQGRVSEAEALLQVALEVTQRLRDRDFPSLQKDGNSSRPKLEISESGLDSISSEQEGVKPIHSTTLARMSSLAQAMHGIGKDQEACSLMRECINLCILELGADHPDTLRRKARLDEWQAPCV